MIAKTRRRPELVPTEEHMSTRPHPKSFGAVAAVAFALLLAGLFHGGSAFAAYAGANGKIAYESNVTGNFEIFVMAADGSGQTNVSNSSPAADRDPVWSPDGTKIAFSRASEGHMNVWVMNADGSGQVNLTPGADDGQGHTGTAPTWSPDGTKIAYNDNAFIWVMNADGAGKVRLTPIGSVQYSPAWSPDGTKIACSDGYADIWVMNADGSGLTRLTTSSRGEFRPDWSPDGTKIAYERDGQVWAMNADGNAQTQLTGDDLGEVGNLPAWSPDGTKIVFSSNGFDAPNGHDIFVMNPDGTGVIRLPTPVPASDLDPSWQPTASPLPTLKIGNATVVEGNTGTAPATFVLQLSMPSAQTVTVVYETRNGSAKAPGDYQAAGGTLTFAPGETRKTVTVDVFGDRLFEQTESFSVVLTGSTNATIADSTGIGKIKNDDPEPSLVISDVRRAEGNSGTTNFVLVVTLSTASGATTKVDYATADGTAIAGSDYMAKSSTLKLPAGQTSKAIVVSVIGDITAEPDETFVVTLSNPVGATLADDQAVATIVNDD
jgi:Tol biopolymer transport system component